MIGGLDEPPWLEHAEAMGNPQVGFLPGCRTLIQAGHPDAPQGLALGKIPQRLMSASAHLYAAQMPKWHIILQSELIRSLILAGTPHTLLMIVQMPDSNRQHQSEAGPLSLTNTEGVGTNPSDSGSSLLMADGTVNRQAAEAASTQSYPVLLYQALTLALSAEWGPGDFGACESDSADSSASESSGSEQAEDSAAQQGLTAAGHEKVLAIAVLASTHVCSQIALLEEDDGRATSSNLAHEVSLCMHLLDHETLTKLHTSQPAMVVLHSACKPTVIYSSLYILHICSQTCLQV